MNRGRPREFDREKGLQNAMLVFWRKGYNATSMPDLCEAVGVTAPSLYAAFGSKEKLFVEAVELYNKASVCLLWDQLSSGKTAYESVKNLLFASAKVLSDRDSHPVGCLVTLSTIDEDMPPAVAVHIKKSRTEHLEFFTARIEKAIASGELPSSTDAEALGRVFLSIMQGMAVQAHDGAKPEKLKRVAELAMGAWPVKVSKTKSR